jgi:hypothetical protein
MEGMPLEEPLVRLVLKIVDVIDLEIVPLP